MDWLIDNFAFQLNTPLLFLSILPILALFAWQLIRKYKAGALSYSGLEYAVSSGVRLAKNRQNYRNLLNLLLILLLGMAWTAPEIRTNHPLIFGPAKELHPTFLVAMDVSGSMTEPLGGYVINGQLNTGGPTRFEASQEEIKSYVGSHSETKFGLILFSVRPMLVRWPTLETEFNFRDILDEGMKYTNQSRSRPSQLARFAGGTATRAGLAVANQVLMDDTSSGKSLILIADLIDNTEEIIDGIQAIDTEKIFVHVVAIDPEPQSLDLFTITFNDRPNINIYPVKSSTELADAFDGIESAELERRGGPGSSTYVQDMRWFCALLAFMVMLLSIWLYASKLHRTIK